MATPTAEHTSSALGHSSKGVTPNRWIVDFAHYSIGARPHPHMFYLNPHKSDNLNVCCQICFKQYAIRVHSPTHKQCSGTTHHLHTTYGSDLVKAKCCRCEATIYAVAEEPTVPRSIIQVLQNSRQPIVKDPKAPKFKDTIKMLIRIFTNALEPDAKSINPKNDTFKENFGVDSASDELFVIAGFTLQDDRLHPPKYTPKNIETLQTVLFQLQLVLGEKYSSIVHHDPTHAGTKKLDLSDKAILQTERVCSEGKLGCLSDMTDEWILDAFRTQISHSATSAHLRIDELIEVKNVRRTEKLDFEIALQRSEGVVCTTELEDAYKAFDIPGGGKDISDMILLDLLRASRSQGSKENLKIILKHRNNSDLSDLVNTPDMDTTDHEDVGWAIYHTQNPVGLVNIGNTCYLNSLLQYIYTINDIRETVINMEVNTEDEDDPKWQGKVIDGRSLTKQDMSEAKKIVAELKRLFVQMRSATATVRPSEVLANILLETGRASSSDISTFQNKQDSRDQQDVVETMALLMNRLSSAFEPMKDRFNSLLFVKAYNKRFGKNEKSGQEEERRIPNGFSSLILNATMDASMEDLIDDFFNAREPPSSESLAPQSIVFNKATTTTDPSTNGEDSSHAVNVSELPPIMQVHLSRTVFDKSTKITRKSDASVSIPKRLYLDEYLDENKEDNSRGGYKKIKLWRGERRKCREALATLRRASVPNIERSEPLATGSSSTLSEEALLAQDTVIQDKVDYQLKTMTQLNQDIEREIQSLAESEYRLHAVFHHMGEATFGHYWVYIYDHQKGSEARWIKYSDEEVTDIRLDQEGEVFNGVEGSTAIFCVYVRDTDSNIVQTVHRVIQ
ncbi:ubiquitin-specific protease ubp2 [Podila epicladia]|nr:ubiquitin-specific protease ubp2 [Podila epicladia]